MNPFQTLPNSMSGMGAQGPNMFADKGHPSGPAGVAKPTGGS